MYIHVCNSLKQTNLEPCLVWLLPHWRHTSCTPLEHCQHRLHRIRGCYRRRFGQGSREYYQTSRVCPRRMASGQSMKQSSRVHCYQVHLIIRVLHHVTDKRERTGIAKHDSFCDANRVDEDVGSWCIIRHLVVGEDQGYRIGLSFLQTDLWPHNVMSTSCKQAIMFSELHGS